MLCGAGNTLHVHATFKTLWFSLPLRIQQSFRAEPFATQWMFGLSYVLILSKAFFCVFFSQVCICIHVCMGILLVKSAEKGKQGWQLLLLFFGGLKMQISICYIFYVQCIFLLLESVFFFFLYCPYSCNKLIKILKIPARKLQKQDLL